LRMTTDPLTRSAGRSLELTRIATSMVAPVFAGFAAEVSVSVVVAFATVRMMLPVADVNSSFPA
jgi:hypothetical protein